MKNLRLISRRTFLRLFGSGFMAMALPILRIREPVSTSPVLIQIRTILPQSFFEPSSIAVTQGTHVTWENAGVLTQSLSCEPEQTDSPAQLPEGAEAWDSGLLYTGQTYSRVFDVPGIYVYQSRYGRSAVVLGVIEVVVSSSDRMTIKGDQ